MVDDLNNEELLKEADAAQKEYDEAMVCEGVSVVDNSNQFMVEMNGGRICIIGPNKQKLTKTELCKLKDMMGFNYEQAIVTKREYRTDITHDKKNNKPLYTLNEIVQKHNDVWMDEYETDRSGLHEVICDKKLLIDNHEFNLTTDEPLEITIYEYNLDITERTYHDILKFYNDSETSEGKRVDKHMELEIHKINYNPRMDKTILSTSGTTVVTLNLNPDNIVSNGTSTIIFSGTMNVNFGSQAVIAGGAPALPYIPR